MQQIRKYHRLLEDITFKYIFGYNKNIRFTEWLLENLYNLELGSLKGKIVIVNSLKPDKIDHDGKNLELDVVILMKESNKVINLEAYTNGFDKNKRKKSLLYITSIFGTQLGSGIKYNKVNEYVQINFVEKTRRRSGTYAFLRVQDGKEEFVEGTIKADILNIDKSKDSGYNVNENIEKMYQLMKAKNAEEAKEIVKGVKMLMDMEETIERFTKEEWFSEMFGMKATYEFYHQAKMEDLKEKMEKKLEKTAELKLQEGIKEGRQAGIEQEKIETAKNLLQDGIPIEKIKKYTGLPIKTINTIAV